MIISPLKKQITIRNINQRIKLPKISTHSKQSTVKSFRVLNNLPQLVEYIHTSPQIYEPFSEQHSLRILNCQFNQTFIEHLRNISEHSCASLNPSLISSVCFTSSKLIMFLQISWGTKVRVWGENEINRM